MSLPHLGLAPYNCGPTATLILAPSPQLTKGWLVATLSSTETSEVQKAHAPTYADPPGYQHFWLRRLHSAVGLVFGGYVTVHLLVNATGFSPKVYQQNVDKIHSLEPMLPAIEIAAIFLPLLIHMVYGAYIGIAGVKFNTTKYNYGGNVRYFLQRVTAFILLAFLVYHVGTLHHWGFAALGWNGGQALFNPKNLAYQTTVGAIKSPYGDNTALNLAVSIFYLLGIWSAVFHWANGFWTSAIAWGATITAASQKRWGHVCFAFAIVMLAVGTAAWCAFAVTGDASVPSGQGEAGSTWTLPEEQAEEVHGQATGGKESSGSVHVPANVKPNSTSTPAPATSTGH